MTTQTVKLDKRKVDFLSEDLQKAWEGADVFVTADEKSITFSRFQESAQLVREAMKRKGLTEEDILKDFEASRTEPRIDLKQQMRERATARATEDIQTAEDWFPLENEAWFQKEGA